MMNLQNWKDITRESYNTHAQDFAHHTSIYRGKLNNWINYFTSQFAYESLVLDVGCGAGRDAQYFLDSGLQVIGIDFSEKLIELAQKNVRAGRFYVMDFEKLVFKHNMFNGIWASASLVHIPKKNLLPVLKKIYTVLKKGGIFFSLFRVGEAEKFTEEKRGEAILKRFYSYYRPEEIRQLLIKAKFTINEEELDSIDSGNWVAFFARK